MSKRQHEDEEPEKEEEAGPPEPKRMEVDELVVEVKHEKTPPIIPSPIVIQRQYTVDEVVTMLVKYLTVSDVTVRKEIHNFRDFGNRVRATGRSWTKIPWSDVQLKRAQWFKANRMSSLVPGTWQLERVFHEPWFFPLYHDFEEIEISLTEAVSMEPGPSGLQGPNSVCLVRRSSSEDSEGDGEQCMECFGVCSSWTAAMALHTLTANHYILVYLAVGVYRAKWRLDDAKAVYSMKVANYREDLPYAIQICRQHLRDTKIFMELNYLVFKLQARPTIIFRIYAIAKILQEFADSPPITRLRFEPFVEICYEQFLQGVLRHMFPNEQVEAFVNQL